MWCIFALVYIILTVFSALVVIRLPGHRLPYALLFVGSLFTAIQCGANIAYILVGNNLLNFPPIKVQVGLNISSAFFGNWSSPFLFLTLALLFADRHATVKRTADGIVGRSNLIFTVLNYAYFGFLMIMATAASGLLATYDLDVQVDDTSTIVTEKFILKLIHDYNVYKNVNYAFLAFFFATILYIAGCAYYVRRTIHRSTISDRVRISFIHAGNAKANSLGSPDCLFHVLHGCPYLHRRCPHLHDFHDCLLSLRAACEGNGQAASNRRHRKRPSAELLLCCRGGHSPARWHASSALECSKCVRVHIVAQRRLTCIDRLCSTRITVSEDAGYTAGWLP